MDKRTLPRGLDEHYGKIRIRYAEYKETLNLSAGNKKHIAVAVTELNEIRHRMQNGLAPRPCQDDGKVMEFCQAAEEYLTVTQASVRLSTYRGYCNALRHHWAQHFKNIPISEITQRQVKLALASMDVQDKAKKNRLVPLSCMFAHFGFSLNPASGIRFARKQKAIVQRYTIKERELIINAMDGRAQLYHVLLFGCGYRPGEALGLKKRDYDPITHLMNTNRQITDSREVATLKNYAARYVYIPEWVRAFLEPELKLLEDDEYVLQTDQGGPILDRVNLYQAWRTAHSDTGVPYRIAYVCRHTRAAELMSLGVSYGEAAEQLGHSPEMFLRIYSEFKREYSGKRDLSHLDAVGVKKQKRKPDHLRLVEVVRDA